MQYFLNDDDLSEAYFRNLSSNGDGGKGRTRRLEEIIITSGLQSLYPRFLQENINFHIAQSLSDGQLSSLGVTTIGERHRLRLTLRDAEKQQGKMLEHLGYTGITGHFLHFECVR